MKNQTTIDVSGTGASSPRDFDLGQWLGRHQAFGMISGKTAAADAECLRRIRDERLFKSKAGSWTEFCTRYVGASKTQVNLMIRHLEEFGPQFFELSALTRITPATYRAIAAQVSPQGLLLDGEVIPLSQEHSERISSAVAELRTRVSPPKAADPAPAPPSDFAQVEAGIEKAIGTLATLPPLDARQKLSLAALIMRLRATSAAAGVRLLG